MRLATDGHKSFARGMNTSVAPNEVAEDQVSLMVNCRVSRQGAAIEPRRGYVSVDDSQDSQHSQGNEVLQLSENITPAGVHQLMRYTVNFGVEISLDYGSTWTRVGTTGLTRGLFSRGLGRPVPASEQTRGLFARGLGVGGVNVALTGTEGVRTAVIREGNNNVTVVVDGGAASVGHQWQGSAWQTIPNMPTGAKYVAVHGGRLVVAGHNGIEVAASKVDDIDTWAAPDGWVVQAATHDGDTEIRGLLSLGTILLVFKKRSVGYIEGYGYQTLQISAGARGISRNIGLLAPQSLQAVGSTGCMWMSERGFEHFDLSTREVKSVSGPMRGVIDDISADIIERDAGIIAFGKDTLALQGPRSLYWPEKHEYWCAFPTVRLTNYGLNHWVYVYRPAIGGAPDAQWLLYFPGDRQGFNQTAEIGADGYLAMKAATGTTRLYQSTVDYQHGLWAKVRADGYLEATDLPANALPFQAPVTLGIDLLRTNPGPINAMGIADTPYAPAQPYFGTEFTQIMVAESKEGFEVVSGVPQLPTSPLAETMWPVEWRVRSRPLVFGDERARKKIKRIRFTVEVPAETGTATFYVYPVVDGVRGTMQTKTVTGGTGLVEVTARVGGRGRTLQAEIISDAGGVLLTTLLVDAEIMEGDQR